MTAQMYRQNHNIYVEENRRKPRTGRKEAPVCYLHVVVVRVAAVGGAQRGTMRRRCGCRQRGVNEAAEFGGWSGGDQGRRRLFVGDVGAWSTVGRDHFELKFEIRKGNGGAATDKPGN